MPSVVVSVYLYDEDFGDHIGLGTAKVFTSYFDGEYVLLDHEFDPVNKYAGSTAWLECPYCGIRERIEIPKSLPGFWGNHGAHTLRLNCKYREWNGVCAGAGGLT
nr:MAG: putative movement protein P1 [Sobemovirus sp.]UHS71658.1 MAG: putative movement protein P1 [Sobemovirus sp.]